MKHTSTVDPVEYNSKEGDYSVKMFILINQIYCLILTHNPVLSFFSIYNSCEDEKT